MPKICVIVPTKNVMPYLDRLFSAINKLDYPVNRLVWIFADGESNDGTFAYLKKKKIKFRKIVITKKKSTRPNARNEAYRYIVENKIPFDFISTVDADVLLYPDFFKRMIKHFNNKEIGMAASYFMYDKNKFLADYTNSYLGGKMGKAVVTDSCATGCGVFRKGCFDFFDEAFECHEDGDLAMSIAEKGWHGIQDFTATCPHIKDQTVKKELKELYGMGYYEPLLWIKHPRYFWSKRVLFGSGFYMLTLLSLPLLILSAIRIAPAWLLFLFPSLLAASFLIHMRQIKNTPLKRALYSAFTTFRFLIYFTAAVHRLIKLPFQKITFSTANVKRQKESFNTF